MRVKTTIDYPIEEVKRLCAVASRGINHKGFTIWIKNSRHAYAGRAYLYRNYAVVRVGRPEHYPLQAHYRGLKRAPYFTLNNWQEAIVAVVAHELRHLQQYKLRKPRSEVDAERWAVKRLDAYRETIGK